MTTMTIGEIPAWWDVVGIIGLSVCILVLCLSVYAIVGLIFGEKEDKCLDENIEHDFGPFFECDGMYEQRICHLCGKTERIRKYSL